MNLPTLIWFRNDLRLADNPALHAAVESGGAVIPVFIHSPDEEAPWEPGAASRWWLHHSLRSLDDSLRTIGSRLIVRRGAALGQLRQLLKETGARTVFWNRRYEPAVIARDARIKEALTADGMDARSFNAALLHEPWTVQNQSRRPFQVFTPFWRRCLAKAEPAAPLRAPAQLAAPTRWPDSLSVQDLKLEPVLNWTAGMRAAWTIGEPAAQRSLARFISEAFADYTEQRNRPDHTGTSRLSPHLHFGEISPRQIWHALKTAAARHGPDADAWRSSQFVAELGWREFAHHLLFHFPNTTDEPLRPEFAAFRWRRNPDWLNAWQRGRTGYPIVDAGMRELWATGWMHNRVRMITASFLVKDLLIDWNEGARWFWDTLVDADLAQNTLGWQWTAGCGADAAPFFRVFNPTVQGEKSDPEGHYVRRWCPELGKLPLKWVHQPHAAPAQVLHAAGVKLGTNYPEPIVSHTIAREVALEAYARLKSQPV